MTKKPTLTQLQQQVAELTEALQRERADSENIRRRYDEQIGSLKNLVKANVVRDLLPVIDNIERLHQHVSSQSEKQGVEQILKQLQKTLSDLGVQRIETVGQVFDPRLHEAVSMEDGSGIVEVISEELQAGYTLGDEVIRHAMVRVRMESAQENAKSNTQKGRP